MKRFYRILLSALPALLLSVSCGKNNPDTPAPTPVDTYEAAIEISQGRTITLGADEGSNAKLIFSCDHEWTIEVPEDAGWITLSKTSGKTSKNAIVTVKAAKNTGTARSATCRIISGASKKKFSVSQDAVTLVLEASEVADLDKYYKPAEFNFDMLRSDSKWSWCRSKQSEHFVVFWDKQYGEYGLYGERMGEENTSPTTAKSTSMQVDIDDLLKKAEQFYDLNVNTLKFAEVGKGKSVLDRYKMEIYILYQSDWLATGSGYDNTIGALWVNPSTCHPVGSTIAHEIGHCFQYMVFCDWLLQNGITGSAALSADGAQGPGWRYGFGANGSGGNCFWEQCAQWQSYQLYPSEAFTGWHEEFTSSTYLHLIHERPRYANCFIQWWWCQENDDIAFLGKLWRESKYPEDPCETYMRLMGYDVARFNDSVWEYAARCVTYDFDAVASYGKNHIGDVAINNVSSADGWWSIAAVKAPESTGSNVIQMTIPSGGTASVTLEGNLGLSGCVSGSVTVAGWRYGFVSYNKDGSRTYSDIWSDTGAEHTFTVPSNSSKLWFVVTGAPTVYERHPWVDDSDSKDKKWPWKASFSGTKPYGK